MPSGVGFDMERTIGLGASAARANLRRQNVRYTEDASAAVATPVAGAVFGGLQGAPVEITGLFSHIE
jgi:Na+/glutamate symporter